MKNILTYLGAALAILAGSAPQLHAHGHLGAGSIGGTLVLFDAEGNPMPATNPHVYHMVLRPDTPTYGGYGGYYSFDELLPNDYPNDYFSFTAYSDGWSLPANPNHAATGSQIWMRILSVSGPAGSTFAFWDSLVAVYGDTPTQTFLTDGSPSAFSFILSEPDADLDPEDQDPYGHLHDRGFTATMPGTYTVQFQLYDGSGFDLELPSQVYSFTFVAVPEPATGALAALGLGLLLASRRRRRSTGKNPSPLHS